MHVIAKVLLKTAEKSIMLFPWNNLTLLKQTNKKKHSHSLAFNFSSP